MKLTKRLLEAMDEALNFRLAGPIEEMEDAPKHDDYEDALTWVSNEYVKLVKAKGTANQ